MLKRFILTLALCAMTAVACATPSPTVSSLSWTAYTDKSAAGFYVYWREELTSSTYNNTNRVQVPNVAAVTEALSAVFPTTHPSSVCFVLTAYDAAGNESGYSNEVCGFMGFSNPAGVTVK